MNILSRFVHRVKARRYARLASLLQRNLTEYVLLEESRISVYLHRAGWHMARSKPRAARVRPIDPARLPSCAATNGHGSPMAAAPQFFFRSSAAPSKSLRPD